MVKKTIKISEVKSLLAAGKKVKVKTLNKKYCNILNFVDKGELDTYNIVLDNEMSVKTSANHRCFSTNGWIQTRNIKPNITMLLCEDSKYYVVKKIEFLGKQKIVDITVDHPESCYFGNGILHHNTGKSLLAYHILANTQKQGGLAVYIDIERSLSEDFMARMGVDTNKLIVPKHIPDHIEGVFTYIENIIKAAEAKYSKKNIPITVVWDSVAATMSKETIEKKYGEGRITPEARAMSDCFKRVMPNLDMGHVTLVCINQLRKNIGVMFGDDEITPHGKALPFYASVRIKMQSSIKKLKDENNGRVIGVPTTAKVFKNKVGPAHRSAKFNIMFDWGVDDDPSLYTLLEESEIIEKTYGWRTYTDISGEVHKFQDPDGTGKWRELLEDSKFRESVNIHVRDKLIIDFKKRPTTYKVVGNEKLKEPDIDTDSFMEMQQLKDNLKKK